MLPFRSRSKKYSSFPDEILALLYRINSLEVSLSHANARRSEKAGLMHFSREMGSALVMALIAIVYVIQAFKIPTGSMEDSLLVGDFLLGLKFIYGAPVLPFSQELGITQRLPAITQPKQGDVIIFRYPGSDKKDYIKRCVAGPGSVVQVKGRQLLIDGKALVPPPRGKFLNNGQLDPRITEFKPLRVPKKGDAIRTDSLDTREFVFLKHLIKQENPKINMKTDFQLYINGEFSNQQIVSIIEPISGREYPVPFNDLRFEYDDWTHLDNLLTMVNNSFPGKDVVIRKLIYINGKPIDEYKVKYDNYFMMGDNRDNSLDSRYWGFLNHNYIKAKAFILYFSLDKDTPYWQLPLKIRWDRIGKLIRSWDGLAPATAVK